jgi:hypothetical protein
VSLVQTLVTLVFESLERREPPHATEGNFVSSCALRVFVLKTCPTPPTGPSVLTKTTKRSTKDTKSARQGPYWWGLAENFPRVWRCRPAPTPPFPQQIPQNEKTSCSGPDGGQSWAIMPPMTRHKATQTGLMTPSPLDRWINALLRGLAMLVSHVARRFVSRHPISAAECDGDCDRPPEADFVLDQHQEPIPAAASSQPIEALMVSSVAIATRPSNHEGRLTALSTSHPRPCAEDLGCRSGGTLTNPHDLPTGIPGSSPRMTRGWVCAETSTACAPN